MTTFTFSRFLFSFCPPIHFGGLFSCNVSPSVLITAFLFLNSFSFFLSSCLQYIFVSFQVFSSLYLSTSNLLSLSSFVILQHSPLLFRFPFSFSMSSVSEGLSVYFSLAFHPPIQQSVDHSMCSSFFNTILCPQPSLCIFFTLFVYIVICQQSTRAAVIFVPAWLLFNQQWNWR